MQGAITAVQVDMRRGAHSLTWRPQFHMWRFSCLSVYLNAARERSLPRRHRSTSLHLLNTGVATTTPLWGHEPTISSDRGPTPCPLGQGGSCCASRRLSSPCNMRHIVSLIKHVVAWDAACAGCQQGNCGCKNAYDLGRPQTCNLRLRGPTPYPLGQDSVWPAAWKSG